LFLTDFALVHGLFFDGGELLLAIAKLVLGVDEILLFLHVIVVILASNLGGGKLHLTFKHFLFTLLSVLHELKVHDSVAVGLLGPLVGVFAGIVKVHYELVVLSTIFRARFFTFRAVNLTVNLLCCLLSELIFRLVTVIALSLTFFTTGISFTSSHLPGLMSEQLLITHSFMVSVFGVFVVHVLESL